MERIRSTIGATPMAVDRGRTILYLRAAGGVASYDGINGDLRDLMHGAEKALAEARTAAQGEVQLVSSVAARS